MDDTIIMDSVIQKYFAGETSEQEEKYLLAWLEESEEHRKYFFELKSLWGARRVFEESTDLAHFASFMRSTGHRIGKIAAGERYARRRKLVRWTLGAAAAVLLAVCAGTAWHFLSTPDIYRVYENTGDAVTTVTLDDGTHVWLNAGTKLIYPKQFNRSMRQVYLSGEMFADVRRDEDRPFIVSADRLEVKVLGTQFNLKSYQEDAKSEVSLVRGKVSVGIKASKMNGKLTLAPGDILRFNKTNNHIDFLNFDPDSYANWIDNNNFFFVEQTLGDIVADLRRHFAVEIVVTDKSLCDETYYASFVNEESLDEILDALNKDRLFSVRREAEVYYISPPLK